MKSHIFTRLSLFFSQGRGIVSVLFFLVSALFFVTCKKDKVPELQISFSDPVVGTVGVSSATMTFTVSANLGDEILERGACWDTLSTPTIQKNKVDNGKGTGSFTVELTGLQGGTRYFVRSYVRTSTEIIYGEETSITTLQLPSVQTLPVANISGTSADCFGNLVSDGGLPIKEMGFCLDTLPSPDTSKYRHKLTTVTGGTFSKTIGGLRNGQTYYAVAYAMSDAGIAYGNQQVFRTPVPPTVSTASVTSITETSAVTGGELLSDGGVSVLRRGVCWSTSPRPTGGGNFLEDNGSSVSYTLNVKSLIPNTTYYIRAFALNAAGYGYGEDIMFKTLPAPTIAISLVYTMPRSANVEGTVSTNGGTAILERGICWEVYSTNNQPTVDNNKISLGSGPGKFSTVISSLNPGTWYAARTYVKTEGGYFYSTTLTIVTDFSVNLIMPLDKEVVGCCEVNFSWQNPASYYEFQLSRNADFSGPLNISYFSCTAGTPLPLQTGSNLARISGKSICVSMPDASYNGTWYWRVIIYDPYEAQEWSETRSFNFQF